MPSPSRKQSFVGRLKPSQAGLDWIGIAGAAILGAAVGVVCDLALIGLVRLALRLPRRRTISRRDREQLMD